MQTPILATKLHTPSRRSSQVSRPHLLARLKEGSGGTMTLLCAPAGFGKTTLLAEWVERVAMPVGWLTLDRDDNEPALFLRYLSACLTSVGVKIDEREATHPHWDQPEQAHTWLITTINRIVALRSPFSLVLDDYHAIHNQTIHDWIRQLLDYLPANMHLIISSRADPPLALAQLRARGLLNEIRANDLRFQVEEAFTFFNQYGGLNLAAADIALLTEKTEGWIAGLQLAAISLRDHPDRPGFVAAFAGNDRYIADYLADEALGRLTADVHSFLLKTSILDRLEASLCDAITGRRDSARVLESLDQANLFLMPLDNRRQWYRYHALFSDLLHVRLLQEMPSLVPNLHHLASTWFEQNHHPEQAVVHAIRAGDIPRLVHLIQAHALAMLEVGEPALLERQLREVPLTSASEHIWIAIARAWSSVFAGRVERAEKALAEAQRWLAGSELDQSSRQKASGHISSIQAYIADMRGEVDRVKRHAREALANLPGDDSLAIAFASMMLATAHNRSGELSRAGVAVKQALDACEPLSNSYIAIDALCMHSKIQALRGQLHDANRTLLRALAVASRDPDDRGRSLPITGFIHIYRSQLLFEWNRLHEAREAATLGLKMLESWGDRDGYLAGMVSLAGAQAALAADAEAAHTIARAKEIAREMPLWLELLQSLEVLLAAVRKDSPDLVERWLQTGPYLEQAPTIQRETHYRYLVTIYYLRGDYERSASILAQILPLVRASESVDAKIRLLALQAAVLEGLVQHRQAVAALKQALDLARPGGYVRAFISLGAGLAPVLYQLAQQGVHPHYCSDLLAVLMESDQKGAPASKRSTPDLIEPLTERELEILELVAAGLQNQEIAAALVISVATVKSHVHHILAKLGVRNRTEAVSKARMLGILI